MSISYLDPFTGVEGKTCSVGAAYASKVQNDLGFRMTEAEWESQQHLGTWGVVKGKYLNGDLPDLPFAEYKGIGGAHYKIGMKNGKLTQYSVNSKTTFYPTLDTVDNIIHHAAKGTGGIDEFKWLGQSVPDKPNVPLGSKSTGSLTDEDVAALFVKVKDDIAKKRFINIKGANPALDKDVYETIAKHTGYTASEIQAKVNAYKATGKKLSALKKKVKAGKAKTADVSHPKTELTEADLDTLGKELEADLSESDKAILKELEDDDPAALDLDSKFKVDTHVDSIKGQKVYDANGNHVGYVRKYESSTPVMGKTNYSVGTTKETKWYVHDINGKKIESIWPPKTMSGAVDKLREHLKKNGLPNTPKVVPVEAAADVAKAVTDDVLKSMPKYDDETVAKAYIKAKDQLAANPDNPWTLYTQNNKEFDDAIYSTMEKFYGIETDPYQIQTQIARYLGDGNKLSVLKKKMAKTGEYVPQADTLKKKVGTAGSKTQAKKQIDEMAGVYNPKGVGGPLSEDYASFHKQHVFDQGKNNIYASMQPQNLYDQLEAMRDNLKAVYPGFKEPSVLDMVRVYDEMKAKQLGIPNGFFYEKKLAEWASSPSGQSILKAKWSAKELEANLPPLPADSSKFPVVSPADMSSLQRRIRPKWTEAEKRALQSYTGSGYSTYNGALRRGSVSGSTRDTINSMIKGMDPLPQDMLVHRGASFQQFGLGSYENALSQIGKQAVDEGFLSTSVGGNAAFGGELKLELELPKGTVGAYVDDISSFRGEREYIVAPGTKFKILTVKKQGYQTVVRARAVPGSHTKRV